MDVGGPPAVVQKKMPLTPKAIINQRFGGQACYKVEEVHESTQNGCPGLSIPQKGPCLYRCCLELPEFSVVSEAFKRKKDAEQSAAEMALEKLGMSTTTDDSTVQDPWDEFVDRLSYFFSNEFLLSSHPLSGHFRAALRREGQLNGLIPISVFAVCDTKISNLCKSINPKVESNPLLIISLILKAAPRLSGSVSTSEEQLSMQREKPYPPEIIQSVANKQSSLQESIWVEVVRIPCLVEKTVEPLTLNFASEGYYLDVIAQELGLTDAFKVMMSRTIGKASSEMRLYFCASNSHLDPSLEALCSEGFLNARASYLSGHPIYGDAILASIGYTWKPTDLFYDDVSLCKYYRVLINMTPSGVYKLSREAILAAELPGTFTAHTNWKGSFRDLICTFCRQHHLFEPVFSVVSNPLESPISPESHNSKVTDQGNEKMNACGNAIGGSNQVSRATFRCGVKIFSKSQDLIIECSPKESFKKQYDAIQNVAWKILSWLDKYFRKPDMPLEDLMSFGDVLDVQFHHQLFYRKFSLCKSVNKFWQSIGTQEGRLIGSDYMNQLNGMVGDRGCPIIIEGPDSGVSPSNGSLVCVIYTICLVKQTEYMKELIESSEEFEFEIGTGSVMLCVEGVVTQMSERQSARFYMNLPPQEWILASARDTSIILPLLTSGGCNLECSILLLRVTEPMEDRMEQALFSPPLSKQRVEYALQHIKEYCATSLVDFGCGSGSLLESLLDYPTSLEKIIGVDISQKGLARAAKVLHSKLSRSTDATTSTMGIRTALLYDGSITVFDSRLYGFDIGTCLEVIEHMEEDQASLFGDVVLSSFCPRILIVSTPNYEYNVILQRSAPQEEDDDEKSQPQPCKFRNHDHKFEWTREQFRSWASDLAARHNYSVEFSGVGGDGDKEPGFASQIALFRRRDECPRNVAVTHKYQIIWEWNATDTDSSTSAP